MRSPYISGLDLLTEAVQDGDVFEHGGHGERGLLHVEGQVEEGERADILGEVLGSHSILLKRRGRRRGGKEERERERERGGGREGGGRGEGGGRSEENV